jgi:hypothetical protein
MKSVTSPHVRRNALPPAKNRQQADPEVYALLVNCLAYSSDLRMEARLSSETSTESQTKKQYSSCIYSFHMILRINSDYRLEHNAETYHTT